MSGGIVSREAFAEGRLPLVDDKFLAQSLALEAGYRYSDYNLGFKTNTYKIGLEWSPISELRLRGSFQRAVRAPNVIELFSPQSVALDGEHRPLRRYGRATCRQGHHGGAMRCGGCSGDSNLRRYAEFGRSIQRLDRR